MQTMFQPKWTQPYDGQHAGRGRYGPQTGPVSEFLAWTLTLTAEQRSHLRTLTVPSADARERLRAALSADQPSRREGLAQLTVALRHRFPTQDVAERAFTQATFAIACRDLLDERDYAQYVSTARSLFDRCASS
jgi:hypothetical protein